MTEKKYTILIVDDGEAHTTVLSGELTYEGYKVFTARDGDEAISILNERRFDLILLDIKMPRVDGFEVLKYVKKKHAQTKVIMVSAFADIKNAIESKKLGAEDFISKPFDLVDLLTTIERVLSEDEPSWMPEKVTQQSDIIMDLAVLRNLIAGISHSLKGEFTNIRGSISEIQSLASGKKEILEECEVVMRSVDLSQLLLRKTIDLTSMGQIQRAAISVDEIVDKIVKLFEPRIPSNLDFSIDIYQNARGVKFVADREQTLLILNELISNSIYALRNTGGKIQVSFAVKENNLIIQVKDNGPGIPPELRKRILSERVESKSGLGIGLFLCAKIASFMDGELYLSAGEKRGATFFLRLPLEN